MYKYLTLFYLKNNVRSKFVEVEIHIRKNFPAAKLSYGELILRRNIRTMKYPMAKFPYREISIRQNFLKSRFPYAKCPTAKIPTAKFPTAKLLITAVSKDSCYSLSCFSYEAVCIYVCQSFVFILGDSLILFW